MSYSVELRTYIGIGGDSILPHTFLVTKDQYGNEQYWGFAPEETELIGPGQIDIEWHPYDSTSGQIPLTEQQYLNLLEGIAKSYTNPPEYNLPLGQQCTVWALNQLADADIIPQSITPFLDDPELLGIIQTLMFNPYTQTAGFELYDLLAAIDIGDISKSILDYILEIFDMANPMNPEINELWEFAQNWKPYMSPLVLDLDGDGVETFGITADTQVLFDHDGDGIKTATGWVSSDDGILVLDRNGNGLIDNGSELFGVNTKVDGTNAKDGFLALQDQDTNNDGVFDSNDANFANVKVWRDFNGDGISNEGELFSLSELGIASIDLDYTSQDIKVSGDNKSIATGTFTWSDGTIGQVDDINFITNDFYREFTDEIELDNTALSLPNIGGSGMVRDLQEASALSGDLTQTLHEMQDYMTRDEMMDVLDTMLMQWSQTSTMQGSIEKADELQGKTLVYLPSTSSSDMRLYVDMNIHFFYVTQGGNGVGGIESISPEDSARYEALKAQSEHLAKIVTILEQFNGENFVDISQEVTATSSSATITNFIGKISDESSSSGGFGTVEYEIPYTFVGLSSRQVEVLEQSYTALKESVYGSLVLQTRLKTYMDAITLSFDEGGFGLDMSGAIDMLDTLLESDLKNAVIDWNDLLHYGQNTFGILADNLTSSLHDWMNFVANDATMMEELKVLEGLELADGALLVGSFEADSIDTGYTSSDNVILAGSGDDIVETKAGNTLVFAGSGDDIVTTGVGNDVVDGHDGNDTITTGSGDDTVYGGDGNDVINAGSGNDIIIGGEGDDVLSGSYGSDTYLYNRGDGKDIIREYDHWIRGTDVLIFGEGISRDDIIAKVDGNNLILALKEDGKSFDELTDKITLENWYKDFYSVEEIQFHDGTKLTMFNDIISLLSTDGDDIIKGYNSQDNIIDAGVGNDTITIASSKSNVINGGDGNDIISSTSGINTIYGDSGNDTITTGSGDDTVYGGDGNDVINAGSGNDIIIGGEGDDVLSGYYGDDILEGGFGSDVITTGQGADVVVLNDLNAYDTILDFNILNDVFQLDSSIFESLDINMDGIISSENFISGEGISEAGDENDFIIYDQTSGNIFYDADGSADVFTPILIADVRDGLALEVENFVVI